MTTRASFRVPPWPAKVVLETDPVKFMKLAEITKAQIDGMNGCTYRDNGQVVVFIDIKNSEEVIRKTIVHEALHATTSILSNFDIKESPAEVLGVEEIYCYSIEYISDQLLKALRKITK